MAFCGNYRVLRKGPGELKMSDENLVAAVRSHATPEWWDKFRDDPDRYAYVRRWGSVLRREARNRGLLEGRNYG